MKCPRCGREFIVKVATRAVCHNCKILTTMTSVLTTQCENCKNIIQIPVQSNSFLSVQKERAEKN